MTMNIVPFQVNSGSSVINRIQARATTPRRKPLSRPNSSAGSARGVAGTVSVVGDGEVGHRCSAG